ncbi:hypothetical protein Acsp04_64860 [Actinomadura sp. NBRC 104425]|uniref:hypothetical protein n=1 Tax=Actinomadura sp. NBRC 104425 TaxID=3032204 RepID=UPI0024A10676|nr:hypothetical protein [Actinomadura sp. NBRC 104425]GLZ16251.1 hypothetical protein Acsp04_64860 [Actinomadura sp. NBRC 104425]
MSGAGPQLAGDGYVGIPRALWAAVLVALDSEDTDLRTAVYAEVLGLGLPAWQDDLDETTVLARHIRQVTGLQVDADPLPPGWTTPRPTLTPTPAPGP